MRAPAARGGAARRRAKRAALEVVEKVLTRRGTPPASCVAARFARRSGRGPVAPWRCRSSSQASALSAIVLAPVSTLPTACPSTGSRLTRPRPPTVASGRTGYPLPTTEHGLGRARRPAPEALLAGPRGAAPAFPRCLRLGGTLTPPVPVRNGQSAEWSEVDRQSGRKHEPATSEGGASPDACFLGEQQSPRPTECSISRRESPARVLPRDCASQGRRPYGSRPARSCLWKAPG